MTTGRGPWERALDSHLRNCSDCLKGARLHDHDCIALDCDPDKPFWCAAAQPYADQFWKEWAK